MKLNRIDLNLLVVFDAVAESGSVKNAAPQLALSQPAVSHALNRLRDLIGDPLFVRSHNRLVPTERARAMIGPVKEILASVLSVMNPEAFDATTVNRSFRIAISDFTALAVIPSLVQKLRKAAPAITLDLIPVGPQTLAQLEAGDLDCSFWGLRPPDAPYLSRLLFHDRFVGFCCKRHPLAQRPDDSIAISDYLAYPHAIAQFGDPNPSPIDVILARSGQARVIALRSPSFMSNISAIPATDMIATLPSRLAPVASSQGLVPFPLPIPVSDFPYSLIWHRRTDTDPACVWLRSLIASPALTEPGEGPVV